MTKVERVMVWGSTAAVSATGFAFTYMKYFMSPVDEFAVVNHPLQPLVLKLHILTAPFLVFGIGLIALRHIWPHFKSGFPKARRSGITIALVGAPMVLTGYLIQAVTHAGVLQVLAWTHIGTGTVFALMGAVHYFASKRKRALAREEIDLAEAATTRIANRLG